MENTAILADNADNSARAPCIPESFATNGFFQNNNVYNSNNSILDLIFSNN